MTNLPTVINQPVAEVQDDYTMVRDNLHKIIVKTNDAVEEVSQLAGASQSHHYYKVVGELIRTELEANRDLVDLHKKKREMETAAGPKEVTNNLIMTSAEVLALIKGENHD